MPAPSKRRIYASRARDVIQGQGVFVSCARGKERIAGPEALEILDESARRLGYDPSQDPRLVQVDDTPDEQDDDRDDDDVEAQIKRELAELHQNKSSGPPQPSRSGQRPPRWLRIVYTDTQCILFIKIPIFIDAVLVVESALKHLASTGEIRSRCVQRLTPITFTCVSADLDAIDRTCRLVIGKAWDPSRTPGFITWRIEQRVRDHTAPLNRDVITQRVGAIAQDILAVPEQNGQAASSRGKVNIGSSSHIISIDVYRNVFGISVIDGTLWDGAGKRFNVEQISAATVAAQADVQMQQ
ncbi:uncharacterized protein L969DRAFT_92406 [Mixia osmundae IAM 14324]|uniref:THUMP domain-containing protein n=1 Tax=Mixia osmundae (strain CBS 9802 / IAM 14324 / JCM 22182 / KY 12970) TaxID=764103 RepID=G7DXM3_MIXOS|nr:uncharacterized protein L969DRAFT_92406 [Mixia osmundae IAM 14324]KEI41173.1 hypothetical protein L969DRAFT_92406 [Mixia osmundae IAM 14324]GAA95333.1 hypothetical protein E5Q_01990 [Mixia osmundae IAM 14324]